MVCNFGNYTGNLQALFGGSGGSFQKNTLSALPGARKVILKDFTHDGRIDVLVLFAQGDERVSLFVNDGARKFSEKILLRFPPVYGSSYFETGDYNNDGFFDILTTNGDNMDYSIVLKPYHGVRLHLNDGKMNFTESVFLPMHGASMAMAHDYDLDGDIDIAAVAFFPDFEKHSDEGFVYFENQGDNQFTARTTPAGTLARWLIMETADYDHDGDVDIFLGALNFPTPVAAINKKWGDKPIPFLILNNQAVDQSARR
ncbi:MAG: VCBS repeat-containing protein [Bacteroidia bacterium]|nr:VCBS repeat-containing protein [Bacteroidia bacterium]